MEKYSSYLPLYLGGRNIERHSSVIEEADAEYYSTLQLMKQWCNLERPLMIQRVATADTVTYTITVKSQKPLQSVTIEGEYTHSTTWTEEEVTTEYTHIFALPNTTGVTMHSFVVTMVDYDDVTYCKGYPENDIAVDDTSLGGVYDHDEFIDRIGLMVGLPRKHYISYNLIDAADTLPPYMGKTVVGGVVAECTEDDYYYLERIRTFLGSLGKQNLALILLELIYGYSGIFEVNSTLLENQQLVDNLCSQDPDFMENISPGCYVFLIPETSPSNYEEITVEGKREFIEKYLPVTRYAVLANTIHTLVCVSDATTPHSLIPAEHREDLYLHDYLFDVFLEEEGEQERVTTPCQLSYTLDSYPAVPVEYDTEDSTSYKDKHLLGPGLHMVNVTYPATLGYERSTTVYTFKTLIDAYHDFIQPFPNPSPFYTPDILDSGNTIVNRANGRLYTRADNYDSDTFTYNMGMVTRDNMMVLEYDIEGYTTTEYYLGVGVTGQGVTKNSNPSRQLAEPLMGRHRVSIELPRGYIYVDGELAALDKAPSKSYVYNNVFLKIPRATASARILESRACQFIPYYEDTLDVYHPNEYFSYLEYTLRAIVDMEEEGSVPVFFGVGSTGLQETIQVTTGRHTIDMQVINNKGYLYLDDAPLGVMYDFTECTQYTYTINGEVESDFTSTRTDPILIFNSVCDFKVTGEEVQEQIVSVGICPTTLRQEIEQGTVVGDITLTCTPDVDELMQNLVEDYPLEFDIKCKSGDTHVSLPLQLEVAGTVYTVPAGSTSFIVPLTGGMIHDDKIYYKLSIPRGRYYREASIDGRILVTGVGAGLFLYPVHLVAGETCTLRARLFDSEGQPVAQRTRAVFRVSGRTIQQPPGTIAYVYSDNEGYITLDYEVPLELEGRIRSIQALTLTTPRLNSNVRDVIVDSPVESVNTQLQLTVGGTRRSTLTDTLTATLLTDDPTIIPDNALTNQGVSFYQLLPNGYIIIGRGVTGSNGVATCTVQYEDLDPIQVYALFSGSSGYLGSQSTTVTVDVIEDVYSDPLLDYLTVENWSVCSTADGTYTTATSNQLTADTTNNTLTDNSTNYYKYNKTLQDFFNYYGDEFSFIAYKTGGDGRFKLGFIKPATGHILGYQSGTATNNEANTSSSNLGEVKYQQYNQITFKKIGTNMHIYWRYNASTYKEATLPLGSIDPTEYYFFFRSDVRGGLTLTTNTALIQNYSRDPNN